MGAQQPQQVPPPPMVQAARHDSTRTTRVGGASSNTIECHLGSNCFNDLAQGGMTTQQFYVAAGVLGVNVGANGPKSKSKSKC